MILSIRADTSSIVKASGVPVKGLQRSANLVGIIDDGNGLVIQIETEDPEIIRFITQDRSERPA